MAVGVRPWWCCGSVQRNVAPDAKFTATAGEVGAMQEERAGDGARVGVGQHVMLGGAALHGNNVTAVTTATVAAAKTTIFLNNMFSIESARTSSGRTLDCQLFTIIVQNE